MCWKMLRTLLADPPAIRIAKHRRKSLAAICVPGMFGWLFQVKFLLVHFELRQVLVTIAIVPSWRVVTSGSSALQMWQNWNSINNCVRNTTCFGWVRRLSSVTWTLKVGKGKKISSNYELSTCLHQMLLNTQQMTHVNVVYIACAPTLVLTKVLCRKKFMHLWSLTSSVSVSDISESDSVSCSVEYSSSWSQSISTSSSPIFSSSCFPSPGCSISDSSTGWFAGWVSVVHVAMKETPSTKKSFSVACALAHQEIASVVYQYIICEFAIQAWVWRMKSHLLEMLLIKLLERLSMTFTANGEMKLFPSVFSSLYSRIKIFLFAVNSKRHFSIFVWFILSAYVMKNIFCLFERPLKIQKNGVFLFEISFFVLEISTFFYYAN